MDKELGHLVLYVRDRQRSVHFYRDVLGWARSWAVTTTRSRSRLSLGLKVGDFDDELLSALATLLENGIPVLGMTDHTDTHSLISLIGWATRLSCTSTSQALTGAPTRA